MERRYPERPIVGVGAVILSGAAVLLARRANPPSKGEWSLPGGVVELGEFIEEALRREIREEVSITMEVGGLVGVYDKIFRDGRGRVLYHYVVVDYWGRPASGRLKAGSDISEVRWLPIREMGRLSLNPDLCQAVRKAAEMGGITIRNELPRRGAAGNETLNPCPPPAD